jgi:hypothetical protein
MIAKFAALLTLGIAFTSRQDTPHCYSRFRMLARRFLSAKPNPISVNAHVPGSGVATNAPTACTLYV